MRRNGFLIGAALVGAAGVIALAVVLLTWDSGERSSSPAIDAAIEARATLAPRTALFGDTIRANVDVMVDTTRVDPDSIRVVTDFSPWEVIGAPERAQRDAGETTLVRTTYVLRCLTGPCVPPGQSAALEFDQVRIAYAGTDAGAASSGRQVIRAGWPLLLVYSRFASANLEDLNTSTAPWHADLLSLPAATYRLGPGVLAAFLLVGAALAALGAAGLGYLAWPRRAPPPPEPEPEPVPEPVLSPLEQALDLLERPVRIDGAADQRRALELVAEELELAPWGDPELARTARVLAWSEDVPPVEETSGLAGRVREALPVVYEVSENGDGHVV